MNRTLLLALLGIGFVVNAQAFDVELVANNKESVSKFIGGQERRSIERWLSASASRETILAKSKASLSSTLKIFKNRDAYCDVGFTRLLKGEAVRSGLVVDQKDFRAYTAYLRETNLIDDILYKNLIASEKLNLALENSNDNRPLVPVINRNSDSTKDIDLKELYADFQKWPDEVSSCSVGRFFRLSASLTWKNKRQRDSLLNKLNYLAFEQKIISLETYNKLEIIKAHKAIDWTVNVFKYLDIVANAKDKLSPTGKPEVDPSEYSTKYADRKAKLTHRGRLYKNFDSTQVMMLADIILKTSKRMDAHYVAINFQYEDRPDSEVETYVLSPMERYRLSIKLLRKDMGEVMRSDLFKNSPVAYEDLVTAAYETGLIRSEELGLILKFEEFWNPKDPKWKIYANFAFSILGTAAIYLPPPWNIVGAIALIVTQVQVNKKQKKATPDDNWNVVI